MAKRARLVEQKLFNFVLCELSTALYKVDLIGSLLYPFHKDERYPRSGSIECGLHPAMKCFRVREAARERRRPLVVRRRRQTLNGWSLVNSVLDQLNG